MMHLLPPGNGLSADIDDGGVAAPIQLLPFNESNFQQLIDWVKDKQLLTQFAGPIFTFPITVEQLLKYTQTTNRQIFSISERTSSQAIGHIELDRIDYEHKSARVCRFLIGRETHRGKKYGQQALEALQKIAFDDLSLNRLELVVLAENVSAIKCYENCGFMTEGVMRESYWMNGKPVSALMMSILSSEYRARHNNGG